MHKAFSKLTYLKDLREHTLSNGAYRVLLAVFNYTDAYGQQAHPGIARLAMDCGMGESTVRRHLTWLKEHGYVVQQSRGHNVGDVNLASVYSLAMPDLPLTIERKAEVATAQSVTPTAHSEQSYRSFQADLPLTTERLSDLSPDLSPDPSSDPFTSDPSGELDHEIPGRPLSRPDTVEPMPPGYRADCSECYWNKRPCNAHMPVLTSVGAAAEPNWDRTRPRGWTDDEPPWD